MAGWEDDMRKADEAARKYHEWAERERAKGNDETADRLHKKGDIVHRTYGSGQRNPVQYDNGGTSSPGGGGLLGCCVMLCVLAAAPAVAWEMWELLA